MMSELRLSYCYSNDIRHEYSLCRPHSAIVHPCKNSSASRRHAKRRKERSHEKEGFTRKRKVYNGRYDYMPPRRAITRWSTEPPSMRYSFAGRSSASWRPPKISRCCLGSIPAFSSTRSLMRHIVSVGSMSISVWLPVSSFTLTSIFSSAKCARCARLKSSVRLACRVRQFEVLALLNLARYTQYRVTTYACIDSLNPTSESASQILLKNADSELLHN